MYFQTSRTATMGLPYKGSHYLFPEEAVWLMEGAFCLVFSDQLPLSVQQGKYFTGLCYELH